MQVYNISGYHLSLENIDELVTSRAFIELSDGAKDRITICRTYLDNRLKEAEDPIYGINTGFGSLHNRSISSEDLNQLQRNLVLSHACGIGAEVPQPIVKLMLLLKIQGLSYGHSGVQLATVNRLIDLYNNDILPVVYQQGSLGASGDLAPLAHLALPLIGEGEVYHDGRKKHASEIYEEFGWQPIELQSKEGLALLNGTQFMSAYAVWEYLKAKKLSEKADLIATISLEAYNGNPEPFDEDLQIIRNHTGQLKTAKNVRQYLTGSEMMKQEKKEVQDPYSFRCIPQVHGASKDTLKHIEKVIENEVNAVTDNPTIFPEKDKILSGGNFHGQPLALVLDQMAIACAEMASISERRIYKLISGQRDLPPYLVANPGLNSGFMIPQYTAASIVSQNKQLCMPSSVDSIDSSNGQEDHVSMGANSATKCYKVIQNLQRVLGIELMNAAQAIEFRRPLKASVRVEKYLADFRNEVPFVENDQYLSPLMRKAEVFVGK
ncbi:MAG: histidine ammonia-lyase [Crocinitomicaceae bacterium]|nr:histidine ammonia-lyase [Crocinitomicaceae bacterium]